MIKLIAMLRKPFAVSREEFQRWWLEEHMPRVRVYPGLRRYEICFALPDTPLGEPIFDGVAEMWWDDLESASACLFSKETAVGHSDTVSHTEIEIRMITDEHIILSEQR